MKAYAFIIGSRKTQEHLEESDLDICLVFEKHPQIIDIKKETLKLNMRYQSNECDILPICLESVNKKLCLSIPSYLSLISLYAQDELPFSILSLSDEQIYHSATLSMLLRFYDIWGHGNKVVSTKNLKRLIWLSELHKTRENIIFSQAFTEKGALYEELKLKQALSLQQWLDVINKRLDELVEYTRESNFLVDFDHVDLFYINRTHFYQCGAISDKVLVNYSIDELVKGFRKYIQA